MRRCLLRFRPRRGEGYVRVCVVTLILAMLAAVLLQYATCVGAVREVRENARTVLDNYVTGQSVEIYDAVKQGRDDCTYIDNDVYCTALAGFCTLEENGYFLYHYDSDGNADFWMSRPALQFEEENRLKLRCTFTVYVPLYFAGRRVGTGTVPIGISSRWTSKITEVN